jgi:hypothetical protein
MKNVKKLLSVVLLIFMALPAPALTLEGNAQYNVESAREETFNNIKYKLKNNDFQDFLSDPNHLNNYKSLRNGKTRAGDRVLALFSDGTYGVRYLKDPYHNYYYEENGVLFKIDVLDKPFGVYPHKSIAYDRRGVFMNATFVISKDEQYLYDTNKKLIGHWIESACYDESGKVLMLRKISK